MKSFQILLVISFLLTACAPRTTAASAPPAQATVASTPLSTETPPVENTKIVPTPTEKAKTIEELAADVLAGKTTLADLPLDQANNIRHEIAEQMKAKGLVHVTFDAGGSNPAYLSPEDFILRQLGDGKSKAEQSIQMYSEVQVDAEGYLWMTNLQGEQVKIDGSAGVDWNEIVTDPNSESIDWPTTEVGKSGLPDAQWFLTLDEEYGLNTAYKRVVLLDKTVGNFFFKDFSGGRGDLSETLRFYMIVTDAQGKPLYARVLLTAPAGVIEAFEEGSAIEKASTILKIETTDMYELLAENGVYWAGIQTDQVAIVSSPNISAGYKGVVPETKSGEVFIGQKTDQQNLLVLLMRMLIKTKP